MTVKSLEVKVQVGEKEFVGNGEVELFSTVDDILQAIEEKNDEGENVGLEDILKHINFSLEAKMRTSIRQKTLAQNAGPENSINRAVTQLMKAREAVGKPISEEKARELVNSMMG